MSEFLMPILGADMQSGTLVAWKKQPGDRVERGDIIAEVETDKADVEVEIFMTGILSTILVEPGTKVPVGTPLAVIAEEGAAVAPGATAAPPPSARPPRPAARTVDAGRPARTPAGERLRVSPSAKQLASELHVDLATVTGTGPGGRIMRRDIEQAAGRAAAPPQAAPPAAADRQARMRQAIAAAMTRSAREIPHFHLSTTIDMSRAMAWLTEENERKPIADRILYGALLIKAVAVALREAPEFNAVWEGDHVRLLPAVHVGVAISLRGGGLVAPALHDTGQRQLDALMKDFSDLVKRVRAGSLRSSEISDPTITITSLGEAGAESVFGLIYPPQVALVGFGRITERVVAVDGAFLVHPVISATLSADHRVADGHRGSLFLAAIDRLLQEPSQL
jgi:pyruvate dehydrogenase E2 component (dihydrolipoamide acetyltransferase)